MDTTDRWRRRLKRDEAGFTFSDRTLDRARKELGIRARQVGAKGDAPQHAMTRSAMEQAGGPGYERDLLAQVPAVTAALDAVRRRRLPLVGDGAGVTSFVHVEDAARATVLALEHPATGTFNVVDDEPATAAEWLPAYASALGAKPPRRLPPFAVRLLAGPTGLAMLAGGEGASNAKARRELRFEPRFASWRQGFEAAL